jgi:sugar phosphate isomerase/epimerase
MSLGPNDLVLCSGTLPRHTTFVDRVDAATAGGFAGISMWGRDYWAARREGHSDADIRARLADHGLAIAELDPAWWWSVDDAAAALAGLCDRAAEHGLVVHVEFLPWSRIADVNAAWEIVRVADRPNAGIAVDAWHWFRGTPDAAALRAIPGNKILGIQLDDAPAEPEANLMTATLHDRLLPGDGAFDLVGLVAALRDAGAVAPIGVEVFSDALHALGPHEAARRAGDATRRVLGGAST